MMKKRGRPSIKDKEDMRIKIKNEDKPISGEITTITPFENDFIEPSNITTDPWYEEPVIEIKEIPLAINVINSNDLPRIKYPYDNNNGINAGQELYKFLTYLALELNPASILEISHDKSFGAIISHYNNFVDSTVDIDLALSMINDRYDYIVVDIDPHTGQFEQSVYDKCKEIGYKGFIVYDDIYLTEGMKSFWNNIPEEEKIDITRYGHWSGSGIVNFNKGLKFTLL